MKKKVVKEKKIVFDTELVEYYTNQIHDGIVLKRFQNPWLYSVRAKYCLSK